MIGSRTAWRGRRVMCGLAALSLSALLASSCSSDKTTPPPAAACPLADGGGPTPGPADDHCTDSATGAKIVQTVGMCLTGDVDAGDADAGAEPPSVVRYGNSAADDDCKYDVSYTIDCVTQGYPVGMTLTLDKRSDGSPVDGADVRADVFLTDTHLARGRTTASSIGPGKYAISGVSFDQAGRWTIRFHFFETCNDTPDDSPHGHVDFYVDVL